MILKIIGSDRMLLIFSHYDRYYFLIQYNPNSKARTYLIMRVSVICIMQYQIIKIPILFTMIVFVFLQLGSVWIPTQNGICHYDLRSGGPNAFLTLKADL